MQSTFNGLMAWFNGLISLVPEVKVTSMQKCFVTIQDAIFHSSFQNSPTIALGLLEKKCVANVNTKRSYFHFAHYSPPLFSWDLYAGMACGCWIYGCF